MYLKVKKAKLVQDQYGQKIEISMIGLYNENDKRVKRVKIDDDILHSLLSTTIDIDAITNRYTSQETPSSTQQILF